MISIRPVAVDDPKAVALVRSYLTEMVDRYHGRPMPASVVDEALADEPAEDVAVLLVAYREGAAVGCVGLRRAEERTGEITKMYVSPPYEGYAEIPPHRDRLYADHWFAKDLPG
jgi:hypothetical protein